MSNSGGIVDHSYTDIIRGMVDDETRCYENLSEEDKALRLIHTEKTRQKFNKFRNKLLPRI